MRESLRKTERDRDREIKKKERMGQREGLGKRRRDIIPKRQRVRGGEGG